MTLLRSPPQTTRRFPRSKRVSPMISCCLVLSRSARARPARSGYMQYPVCFQGVGVYGMTGAASGSLFKGLRTEGPWGDSMDLTTLVGRLVHFACNWGQRSANNSLFRRLSVSPSVAGDPLDMAVAPPSPWTPVAEVQGPALHGSDQSNVYL